MNRRRFFGLCAASAASSICTAAEVAEFVLLPGSATVSGAFVRRHVIPLLNHGWTTAKDGRAKEDA
jgi:hypothetical protein